MLFLFLVSWAPLPSTLSRTIPKSSTALPQREPMVSGQERPDRSFKYKTPAQAVRSDLVQQKNRNVPVVQRLWLNAGRSVQSGLHQVSPTARSKNPFLFQRSKAKIRVQLRGWQNLQSRVGGWGVGRLWVNVSASEPPTPVHKSKVNLR